MDTVAVAAAEASGAVVVTAATRRSLPTIVGTRSFAPARAGFTKSLPSGARPCPARAGPSMPAPRAGHAGNQYCVPAKSAELRCGCRLAEYCINGIFDMDWSVEFLNADVREGLEALPKDIIASSFAFRG